MQCDRRRGCRIGIGLCRVVWLAVIGVDVVVGRLVWALADRFWVLLVSFLFLSVPLLVLLLHYWLFFANHFVVRILPCTFETWTSAHCPYCSLAKTAFGKTILSKGGWTTQLFCGRPRVVVYDLAFWNPEEE